MRPDPERSYAPITPEVLDRLSEIAASDREDRFRRRPRWAPYRDRVLCVALCQGAAIHHLDGAYGVKDLDVWTFYSACDAGPFPWRWRLERRFDRRPFEGHFVDLIGRSLPVELGTDPREVIRGYLSPAKTPSAKALARKAAILLDPEPLRGTVAWPPPEER
jgi:hypothetical protein